MIRSYQHNSILAQQQANQARWRFGSLCMLCLLAHATP
jgi:hypothetical protein